jgi:tripartite-type tricarboxylate transporter receptor subunit TctC
MQVSPAKRLTIALLLLLAAALPAQAQDWPPKAVRILVPFGAGSTPEEFRARIDGEIARWAPVIKAANVKVN